MKLIINLLLIAVILLLSYMLYASIREPILFNNEKVKREDAVVDRLKQVRDAQNIFKGIVGEYASDFDTLSEVLKTGQIKFVKIEGDVDAGEESRITETFSPAIDSIRALNINLDSLRFVPYAKAGTTFEIQADTLTYQQTLVNVLEVGTRYKNFMGKYGSMKYSKYDNSFDPNKTMKFGNMNAPNTTGNWER